MTVDQVQEIQFAAEALLDKVLEAVPHDKRVDMGVMAVRVVLGSLLAYLRELARKP